MENLLPEVSWKYENVVFRVCIYNNRIHFVIWSITVFLEFLLRVSRPLNE